MNFVLIIKIIRLRDNFFILFFKEKTWAQLFIIF